MHELRKKHLVQKHSKIDSVSARGFSAGTCLMLS